MSEEKEKTKLTPKRALTLIVAFLVFCVAGGVMASGAVLPAIIGISSVTKAVTPTLTDTDDVDFSLSDLPQQSRMYASDGTTVIATFYTQNRIIVPLKSISTHMQQAMVAREDRRFFEHSGVDPQSILRAFITTYVSGSGETQGGSTLTQQYVKNMLLEQAEEDDDPIAEYHATEDTIARKIKEMLIAVQIEKKYTKAEILQGYLNIAQFGTSVYGVETAARHYFNKSAADLTIGESALIASITKNPSAYDPTVNPTAAQKQRDIVLDLMQSQGYATAKEVKEAKAVNVSDMLNVQTVQVGCQTAGSAAYFCDYVVHKFLQTKSFGKTEAARRKTLYQGGLNIYTTMDLTAQSAAWDAVREAIPENDSSGFESVIAAMQPGTGKVLAIAQNRTYDATSSASSTSTSINYAVDQKDGGGDGVMTGSTFKPINMASWLSNGHTATESLKTYTSYSQSSFACNPTASGTWSVQNSGGGTVNPETPYSALIWSHNTTQASMAQKIGLCAIADTATSMGYHNSLTSESDIHDTIAPSMIIGSLNASPLTMASVYATIAADGKYCEPIAMTKVTKNGKSYSVPSTNCTQAISSDVAQTVAYILNIGATSGAASSANLGTRKTFAKTGTAESYYMLTAGFTNGVAAYAAAGNMESLSSWTGKSVNGVRHSTWYGMYISAPMWKNFMSTYTTNAGIADDTTYGQASSSLLGSGSTSTSSSSSSTSTGRE